MVEVRITKLRDERGAYFEVCFVLGLLNTYTVQQRFNAQKDARAYIKAQQSKGAVSQSVPIICQ